MSGNTTSIPARISSMFTSASCAGRSTNRAVRPSFAPSAVQAMFSMQFSALRHTTTFRLTVLYGLLFALGTIGLLGMVYMRSAGYLTRRVDSILNTEMSALLRSPPTQVRERLSEELTLNGNRMNVFGLFMASGTRIAGNLVDLPPTLRT